MENTQKNIQTTEPNDGTLDSNTASATLNTMRAFMKEHLKNGTDYMTIPGAKKPSLLKSGAEKMNILMGLHARYVKQKEIINPAEGFYYVEVKCILSKRDRNGISCNVAESLASCNNKEKARVNVAFHDSLNTVLKVAEKRAYVAATLNANAMSQLYAADLEDDVVDDERGICLNCGMECTGKIAKFSRERFQGKVLCFECQKKVKDAQH